ncbi:hypothetical protein Trydic_g9811 [Trypoxylus dichotomus]
MQPGLRERGPDRAYPSPSTRSPHGRGRRRVDMTNVTGRGESHREAVPAEQGPGTGRHHLPRSQARPQEVLPQLATKLPAHQSSLGHGQDRRPDNTYQTAGGNGRPQRYPRLPIRFPQRAQHQSPSAAPRRTHERGLQPTGMHRSGIPRRRQSLRQGLAPGPTPEDAPGRHLQGNGQAHSLLSPQEDLQRRAARVSDLTLAVQHLHQRHPDHRARQPGDVPGRCLHLFEVPQRESDRPTFPDSTRHFAGLVRKVENRRPSPEKHGRAFRDRKSPKKEVRQRAGGFPGKLGSPHTPCARPRTSDVGNPLSDDGGTREARSLA